jgi:hypothetical protein
MTDVLGKPDVEDDAIALRIIRAGELIVKALTAIWLVASLTISLSSPANAVPILLGTTTNPTGINGLVVNGTTYDVTFSTTTLNSFTQGSTLSTNATSALSTALNALGVTMLGDFTLTGDGAYTLDVDDNLTHWDGADCLLIAGSCFNWFSVTASGPPNYFNLGPYLGGLGYIQAAIFTAAPVAGVPEPLTISLFGVGLVALFVLRRRQATTITS